MSSHPLVLAEDSESSSRVQSVGRLGLVCVQTYNGCILMLQNILLSTVYGKLLVFLLIHMRVQCRIFLNHFEYDYAYKRRLIIRLTLALILTLYRL